MTETVEQALQILGRAATIITRDGWYKNGEDNSPWAQCAGSAVMLAAEELYPDAEDSAGAVMSLMALSEAAHELFWDRAGVACTSAFISVNDHKDTTLEDVILMFKHAAVSVSDSW